MLIKFEYYPYSWVDGLTAVCADGCMPGRMVNAEVKGRPKSQFMSLGKK